MIRNLVTRSAIVAAVILCAVLFTLSNFLTQKLVVVFDPYYRLESGERVDVTPDEISDFINDRENGLRLFFPKAVCKPEAEGRLTAEYRCILEDRFITSAKVNEMVQANLDIVDELRTGVTPDGIERFFGFFSRNDYKNLKVKLGLDLQGGMRAIFRADYETYLEKIHEKYDPIAKELRAKLATPGISQSDRDDAQARLDSINVLTNLDEKRKLELLDEAKRIIDKRLVGQNLTEPEVRVQPGSHTIGVDMPGVANATETLGKIKDTVTVEYRIVNDEATDSLNNGQYDTELLAIQKMVTENRFDPIEYKNLLEEVGKKANITDGKVFLNWRRGKRENSAILPREYRVLGPVVLDGSDMTDARENVNPDSAYFMINFELSGDGARKFGEITQNNINKRLAILWGDRVVSDPIIQGAIMGGQGQITGDFTIDQAREISNVIREGALPLPLEVLSVSFIGPSLGQESIVAGLMSLVLGFVLILLFLISYYRWAGAVAIFALFLNLLLTAAILSLLEFTLTLPGIAGAILSLGMAVDANVIVYEKMKEDVRAGKSPSVTVSSSFETSFWTILDSNVTAMIAAVILYYTGDGPIKGFAITLFFGIVSSMFTAVYVSHLLFDWSLHLFKVKRLSIGGRQKVAA